MSERVRTAVVLGGLAVLALVLWRWPPAGDDAYHHSILGVEQVRAWSQGAWWPRFQPDWNGGTGSFVAAVYSPLVLAVDGALTAAVGEGSRALGLSLVLALLTGWLVFRRLGRQEERGRAWLWLVAAYPVATVLARASASEAWALAGAAGVLLLGLPPGPRDQREGLVLAVLTAVTAGCQVSMLIQLAWVLAAGWVAAGLGPRLRAATRAAGWVLAGIVAGGVFWWPLARELRFLAHERLVGGPYYDWHEHFVVSLAGNRGLGPVLLACGIGLIGVVLVALAGGALRSARGRALAGAATAGLVLATPLAAPLWHLPGMAGLQFPWRFLGPATVAAVALAARLDRRRGGLAAALLVLPLALCPVALAPPVPALSPHLDSAALAARAAARYGIAPLLPSSPGFYSAGFDVRRSLAALARQPARVERVEGGEGRSRRFTVGGPGGRALLPLQWWPDWDVEADGAAIGYANDLGLVSVTVPPGRWSVEVRLGPSRARRRGVLLTLAGLLFCGLLALASRRRGLRGGGRRGSGESSSQESAEDLLA